MAGAFRFRGAPALLLYILEKLKKSQKNASKKVHIWLICLL